MINRYFSESELEKQTLNKEGFTDNKILNPYRLFVLSYDSFN